MPHADALEQVPDPAPGLGLGEAGVPHRECDVLRGGPSAQQVRGLEDRADLAAGLAQVAAGEPGQVLAVDGDRAAGGTLQEVDAAGEGALAGAARPDHRGDLRLPDGEVDPVEHGGRPVGLGEPGDLDHPASPLSVGQCFSTEFIDFAGRLRQRSTSPAPTA
nr:hypothetical protein [Pimelobacter simplex]